MSDDIDLEARVRVLETLVRELQLEIASLRKALGEKQIPSAPMLRSHGMLDRPKPGR